MQRQTDYFIGVTAKGYCAVAWQESGVVRFQLPVETHAEAEALLRRRLPDARMCEPDEERTSLMRDVQAYFAGQRVDFSTATVDIGRQSPFFTRVYRFVRELPWGMSTTYGAIARALEAGPEGAREVGQAMAKNPLPLLIPCHRVLAAGSKIGGFSAPGGSTTKQRMLEMEGLFKKDDESAQASLF